MKLKKRILLLISALVLLLSLSVSALASGAGTQVYISDIKIADGLTYRDTVSYDGDYRIESYMLETTPNGDIFPIVLACDTIYGGMSMSSIVRYAASLGYNVLGAVNTDFFTESKVPMGIVIENGILKSSPEGRNILTIDDRGLLDAIEKPGITMTLDNKSNGKSVSISHFNKTRVDAGGTYLYSEHFSTVSTRTSTDGWAVTFRILDGGEIKPNSTLDLEVTDTYSGTDAQPIGSGNLVLTAATLSYKYAEQQSFAIGDRVTLTTSMTGANYDSVKWATGAGDILAEGGGITDSSAWDNAVSGRNPHTVIGIKPDGAAVYYVVDGRSSSHSAGISCMKAAEELLSLGCTTVVNFDGGGSSAMAVRLPGQTAAKTVNRPSDGAERSCSTYILLCSSNLSDGVPARLALNETGTVVLTGSSVGLSYSSVDRGAAPVQLPGEVSATAELGTVSGNTYTAVKPGVDTVSLSSGGVYGEGTIIAIDTLTDLSVRNLADEVIERITLKPGESMRISPVGLFYGIPVQMDHNSVTLSVTGNVGTLSGGEDGTYMFSGVNTFSASGSIEVAAGGKTVSVPVTVGSHFTDIGNHWAKDYINSLSDRGIVTGTTDTAFSPNKNIKRCDFILMLYRAAGNPKITEKQVFSDVPTGKYYSAAITWAQSKGIAQGTGSGTFAPMDTLTREQAFAFVYRALKTLDIPYSDGSASSLKAFSDSSFVASYAVIPTATLVKLGIVDGSGGMLNPKDNLTRAQMAKILWTALDKK